MEKWKNIGMHVLKINFNDPFSIISKEYHFASPTPRRGAALISFTRSMCKAGISTLYLLYRSRTRSSILPVFIWGHDPDRIPAPFTWGSDPKGGLGADHGRPDVEGGGRVMWHPRAVQPNQLPVQVNRWVESMEISRFSNNQLVCPIYHHISSALILYNWFSQY